jgi:hypothetical protein
VEEARELNMSRKTGAVIKIPEGSFRKVNDGPDSVEGNWIKIDAETATKPAPEQPKGPFWRVTGALGGGLGAITEPLKQAGTGVAGVFKAVAVAAATAINVIAKAYYITSANFKLLSRD